MPSLHPESRACLASLGSIVVRPSSGTNHAKAYGTLCSRKRHWMEFCAIHKINDPVLRYLPQSERNFVLACYTVHLSNEATIQDRLIKYETIKNYLGAVADLCSDAKIIDPSKLKSGRWAPYVEKILKELRDIRGVMNKAYQLFWGASILLLLILVVDFI